MEEESKETCVAFFCKKCNNYLVSRYVKINKSYEIYDAPVEYCSNCGNMDSTYK